MQFTSEEFKKMRENREDLYKSIGEVYCPYLKDKVGFNSQGLEHLKFIQREKARLEQDQYMRFKLLHLAPEVLKDSHTVQGVLETKKFERIRVNSRTDNILVPVVYYEFVAVIKRNRVKVIVKEIDMGKKFFWSIIPFWRMNKDNMKRLLHDGIPEED